MADVEKAADAASTLMSKLSEYLDAAEKVVVNYAPQVWDATLQIVRAESIFMLVAWSAALAVGVYGFTRAIAGFKANGKAQNYRDEKEWPVPACVASSLILVMCFVSALCAGVHTLLGVFSPELAILYALCSKAGLL